MNITRSDANAANTLTEVLITVLLVGIFFASIFELNAVCLRYISASKQSVAAIAAVQDRAEVLRNLAFSDLTTTSYVQNLLATAADGSEYVKNMTEVVQLSAYPTANGGDTTDAQHRRECDLEFHRDQPWHHTCEIGYLTIVDGRSQWTQPQRAKFHHYFQRIQEMKRPYAKHESGYTLVEMMMALGIGVTMFGAILTASVALQKTFNAVDHFFSTHMQQIRVIDYLNRDAKRAYIVTTSPDLKTVTMTIPKYIIQATDSRSRRQSVIAINWRYADADDLLHLERFAGELWNFHFDRSLFYQRQHDPAH